MRRDQLEQLVAAVARLTGSRDVVVVGSAALLASLTDVPDELDAGDAADVFASDRPECGASIDTALGVDSMYHEAHGVYARAVGPLTPTAPVGWLDRLVPVPVPGGDGVVARCMEPHDLVIAKLAVGRGKDLDFCVTAVELGVVDPALLAERVEELPLDPGRRAELLRTLVRAVG